MAVAAPNLRTDPDHARMLAELAGPAITIGGDCGVELAAVVHATQRAAGDLAVVWFDALGDLNTPATSPSGALHGMVLRAALGDVVPGLVSAAACAPRPEQVVLAGARAFDPAEQDYIAARPSRPSGGSSMRWLLANGGEAAVVRGSPHAGDLATVSGSSRRRRRAGGYARPAGYPNRRGLRDAKPLTVLAPSASHAGYTRTAGTVIR